MKSVLKRGNVIMDNEIKNVFFDIEMLRRRLIRPFFIELGLTVGQGQPRILKELREHGIMNQKELADACLMDVTTMSRTLDRMEKDGLLKRENNPVSRRSWNVLLTDYGSQKADEVIRIFNRIDNVIYLSLIHISEPTRRTPISYAVFCLKKKKKRAHETDSYLNNSQRKIK